MFDTTKLDNIFDGLIDVEYDLECFLEVLTEMEVFYQMEDKQELEKRCHIVKTEVDRINKLLHKEVVAMDDYILEIRRDSN
jgi:hypothetical protein